MRCLALSSPPRTGIPSLYIGSTITLEHGLQLLSSPKSPIATSPALPLGSHTLNVTVLWSTNTFFWFNYLTYNSSPQAATDTTIHDSSVSSPLLLLTTSMQPVSTMPINTPFPPHASLTSTGYLNTSLVARVAVAVLFGFTVLVTFLILWLWRRNKAQTAEHARPFMVQYTSAGMCV